MSGKKGTSRGGHKHASNNEKSDMYEQIMSPQAHYESLLLAERTLSGRLEEISVNDVLRKDVAVMTVHTSMICALESYVPLSNADDEGDVSKGEDEPARLMDVVSINSLIKHIRREQDEQSLTQQEEAMRIALDKLSTSILPTKSAEIEEEAHSVDSNTEHTDNRGADGFFEDFPDCVDDDNEEDERTFDSGACMTEKIKQHNSNININSTTKTERNATKLSSRRKTPTLINPYVRDQKSSVIAKKNLNPGGEEKKSVDYHNDGENKPKVSNNYHSMSRMMHTPQSWDTYDKCNNKSIYSSVPSVPQVVIPQHYKASHQQPIISMSKVNPFRTAREVEQNDDEGRYHHMNHHDSNRYQHRQIDENTFSRGATISSGHMNNGYTDNGRMNSSQYTNSSYPHHNPYNTNTSHSFRQPQHNEQSYEGRIQKPNLTAGLKRKYKPPKLLPTSKNASGSEGSPSKKKSSSLTARNSNTNATTKDGNVIDEDDDELPEELKHLDKELVSKIESEILDHGETVTFDDIAGLKDAKQTVLELVCWPMKRPDLFTGLRKGPNGLLLFGPPGTGKTLIGKAVAHESGATFFSISSSSLTSKWIGEGEKLVRTLFTVAMYRQPAVVFIDEIDSLLTQRKADENEASRRIKTEFLVQLDGTGGNSASTGMVLVIGATNRPHELDDAARRRFVKRIYVPLPDRSDREILLRTLMNKNLHCMADKDALKLSVDTEGFSGADLKALCTDAALGPIRQLGARALTIKAEDVPPISYRHFRMALKGMKPSVAQSDLDVYVEWNKTYGSTTTVVNIDCEICSDEGSDEDKVTDD